MNFYNILVGETSYKSNDLLTYSSEEKLEVGSIVIVPFKDRLTTGLVVTPTSKPKFKTKDVSSVVSGSKIPIQLVRLLDWLFDYYPSPRSTALHLMLPTGLTTVKPAKEVEVSAVKASSKELPKLNEDQLAVVEHINGSSERTTLIHGQTGSGKTRVYLDLVGQTLKSGKSALVLTPEIGLTPQLFKSFEETFSGQVVVMHSAMTPKKRMLSWHRILESDKPLVVIGPRSALFTPLDNVGLIVIDEEHDSGYKQEQAPYYQTTRVAAKLAELHDAKLILGSATPSISDYYVLASRKSPILKMNKPAVKSLAKYSSSIEVVKLGDKNEFAKSFWISDKLLDSIKKSLDSNEQSLIFLNRRGSALTVSCNLCGWSALCPNCDTHLTYHGDSHLIRCHSCNYSAQTPSNCPVCANSDIIFKGIGTKALVAELEKKFPTSNIKRFDKDNNKSESLSENYHSLLSGDVDIIVGTQLITKGFDLPKLSTVGIITADSALTFPDYTAEERTFQTLMQVMGRAGRGHTNSRIIIQTYNPDSLAIRSAVERNYKAFYESQLAERQQFFFPPFAYLLKVSKAMSSPERVEKDLIKLKEDLARSDLKIEINGPSPSFREKKNNQYVWQLTIRSKDRKELTKLIKMLPSSYTYDIDPSSLL